MFREQKMGVFRTFSVRNAFTNSHPCLEILILRIEDEGEVLSNLVIELADKQMGRVLSVRENGIQSYQDILKESKIELKYSYIHFYFDDWQDSVQSGLLGRVEGAE